MPNAEPETAWFLALRQGQGGGEVARLRLTPEQAAALADKLGVALDRPLRQPVSGGVDGRRLWRDAVSADG